MPAGGEVTGNVPQLQRHDLQLLGVELFGPDGQVNVSTASNPGGASQNGQEASRASTATRWTSGPSGSTTTWTRGNSLLVRVRVRDRVGVRVGIGSPRPGLGLEPIRVGVG